MNSLAIKDLPDSVELDCEAMARVRGGWFFAFSSSSSGSDKTSPTVHEISIMKTTDVSSPVLM